MVENYQGRKVKSTFVHQIHSHAFKKCKPIYMHRCMQNTPGRHAKQISNRKKSKPTHQKQTSKQNGYNVRNAEDAEVLMPDFTTQNPRVFSE